MPEVTKILNLKAIFYHTDHHWYCAICDSRKGIFSIIPWLPQPTLYPHFLVPIMNFLVARIAMFLYSPIEEVKKSLSLIGNSNDYLSRKKSSWIVFIWQNLHCNKKQQTIKHHWPLFNFLCNLTQLNLDSFNLNSPIPLLSPIY